MIAWVRKRPGVAILVAFGLLLLLAAGGYAIAQEPGLFRTESRGNNTIRYQLTQQLPAGFTGRIEPGDGSLYVIPTDLTNGQYVDHQYDQSVVDALGPNGELTWRVYQNGVVQPIQDEKVTVAQITAPAPTPTHTAVQPSATFTNTPTQEMPSATVTSTPSTTSTSRGATVSPTVTNTALSETRTATPSGAPEPGATQTAASQTAVAATAIAGTAIAQTQTAALPLVVPDTFLPLVVSDNAATPTPEPAPVPVPE